VSERTGLGAPAEDSAWEAARQRTTVSLRPIGAPMPIGLFGLAAATFVLSGLQLGWVDQDQSQKVALVLIGFAFVAQLLAAVFSFLGRDGTVATAMSVLALTWLVVGLVLDTSPPGATSAVLGLFLLVTGIAMTMTGLAAATSKLVPAAVFLLAALRFFTMAGYELSGDKAWQTTAGMLGLVLFAVALYAALAAELEDALGRTVFPFGRRGKGKVAVHGSLLEQVKEVPTEPGVRTKL
jgi:succinate-acetate transporter protein